MPIKPENKGRYPANWKEIRASILKRANNRCEFCGVENHTYRWNEKNRKNAHIVLTIAHLDHTPENATQIIFVHCVSVAITAMTQTTEQRQEMRKTENYEAYNSRSSEGRP